MAKGSGGKHKHDTADATESLLEDYVHRSTYLSYDTLVVTIQPCPSLRCAVVAAAHAPRMPDGLRFHDLRETCSSTFR